MFIIRGEECWTGNRDFLTRWIVLSRQSGSTRTEDRIQVSIDWSKEIPSGEKVTGFIEFSSGMQKERVLVSVFNPKTPVRDELQGLS